MRPFEAKLNTRRIAMSRKCEACNGKGEVEWTSVAGVAVDGAVAWNGVKRAKARGWWTMKSRYNVGDVLISTTGIKWTIVFIGERGAVLHTNDGGNISELYCEWITMAEWSKDIPDPTCNGLTLEQFIEHAKRGEIQLYAFEGWQQSGFNINGEKNIPPDWHWICNNESKFRIKPKQESPTISECIAMFKRMGMVGWVAMEEDGEWGIHSTEPICVGGDFWSSNDIIYFTAQPVADWKKSKRRV